MAHVARLQKVYQQKELVCSVKGKVQEGRRKLRRVEEGKAACCYTTREFSVEIYHRIHIIPLDFTIGIYSRDLLQAPDII